MNKTRNVLAVLLIVATIGVFYQAVIFMKSGDPYAKIQPRVKKEVNVERNAPEKDGYTIAEVKEIPVDPSFDINSGLKGLIIDVVVHEEKSINELKTMVQEIVKKQNERHSHSGVMIFLNDRSEFVSFHQTLGIVEFAKNGSFDNAGQTAKGDFENMSFNYNILEKDWSKRVSEEDAKIYKSWTEHMLESGKTSVSSADSEIAKATAKSMNISEERVLRTMDDVYYWVIDGTEEEINQRKIEDLKEDEGTGE